MPGSVSVASKRSPSRTSGGKLFLATLALAGVHLGLFRQRRQPFHATWALAWFEEGGGKPESYVNLIPTAQGGTHVNGLRSGFTDALRKFCEFRNLLPRGVKLAPEDVWDGASYVLSIKVREPQFAGQTKERLTSREAAAFVGTVTKDAFAQWLMQHVADAERIAVLRPQLLRLQADILCLQETKTTAEAFPRGALMRPLSFA